MDNNVASEKRRILIVDDEQGVVNALRRELLLPPFGHHRYAMEIFTNPLEALERAKVQSFEAVLSDYRMPQMNGREFLTALARIQPDCTRIVLSGQTDRDALIRMVNETHIYRFIPKPWSSYYLKSTLAQAVDLYQDSVNRRRLAEQLQGKGIALPPGSLNAIDQILVLDADESSAAAIARCLSSADASSETGGQAGAHAGAHADPAASEQGGDCASFEPARINIQIAHSAAQAMAMAGRTAFSCLITDYRVSGAEESFFLANFAENNPDCACILLSGEASMESIMLALDFAQINAFIAKPWADFELRMAVANALARRRLLLENRVLAAMCKESALSTIS